MFDTTEIDTILDRLTAADQSATSVETDDIDLTVHTVSQPGGSTGTVVFAKAEVPTTINWLVFFPEDTTKLLTELHIHSV